jgi:hypothetical protein
MAWVQAHHNGRRQKRLGLIGAFAQDIDLENAERAFLVKVKRHCPLFSLMRMAVFCISFNQVRPGTG